MVNEQESGDREFGGQLVEAADHRRIVAAEFVDE